MFSLWCRGVKSESTPPTTPPPTTRSPFSVTCYRYGEGLYPNRSLNVDCIPLYVQYSYWWYLGTLPLKWGNVFFTRGSVLYSPKCAMNIHPAKSRSEFPRMIFCEIPLFIDHDRRYMFVPKASSGAQRSTENDIVFLGFISGIGVGEMLDRCIIGRLIKMWW